MIRGWPLLLGLALAPLAIALVLLVHWLRCGCNDPWLASLASVAFALAPLAIALVLLVHWLLAVT